MITLNEFNEMARICTSSRKGVKWQRHIRYSDFPDSASLNIPWRSIDTQKIVTAGFAIITRLNFVYCCPKCRLKEDMFSSSVAYRLCCWETRACEALVQFYTLGNSMPLPNA
jgi:hypothetical protein